MSQLCPHRLCQIEIHVQNLERSLHFYRVAFGWERAPADLHDYVVLEVPEDCPYGISLIPNPPSSSGREFRTIGMVLYFACDNPAEIVRQVENSGGRKRLGPLKVPGFGMIYQIEDPDGHRFGLFSKPKI